MIKIVNGNLLHANENIIAHQVNCMGVYNAGVAKQIREAVPKAYDEYMELVNEHMLGEDLRHTLLGRVQGVMISNKKYVANMFGQIDYGSDGKQYTDTEELFTCFKTVRRIAEGSRLSVAMPYGIGCFRGGADWQEVENLLLIAFEGYEVTLYKL